MIITLSPAKTLEFDKTVPFAESSQPLFLEQTQELVESLKKMSSAQLQELMEISADLADLNYHRFQKWNTPFTKENARQAVFTFNGPVYHGFDWMGYKKADFERLQNTVRIINGLHGLLRPLDLIQAYRLDFHIPLKNSKGDDLYAFWKQTVTDQLNKECKDFLVNCASKEYTQAIDMEQLNCPVIETVFKQPIKGKYRVVGLLAKKARGQFANFVVQQNIKKVSDLHKFSAGGYVFDEKESTENSLVFLKKG